MATSPDLFRPSASELAPAGYVGVAKGIVESYRPWCESQVTERERVLRFIDDHPLHAHERTCMPGHLTGAALLVDSTRTRVLLNHHRKLGRWLQFGGHADGDANLLGVAWRETVEESGIEPMTFSRRPIDLDVHVIPARGAKGARPPSPSTCTSTSATWRSRPRAPSSGARTSRSSCGGSRSRSSRSPAPRSWTSR